MLSLPKPLRVRSIPQLRDPLLLIAMEGWNDGGMAASTAMRYLIRHLDAKLFASIDADAYYVFSENRPQVEWTNQNQRQIIWQKNDFYYAKLPDAERDVILFKGVEPNLKWQSFAALLLEIAKTHQVKMIATLGGFLGDALYSKPVQVSAYSNDLDMEREYGLTSTQYEGPTGMIGVCYNMFQERHYTALSLWAAVPYYISIPNPKAALALLRQLCTIFKFTLNLSTLENAADHFDQEINDVIAKDPQVEAYMNELKKRDLMN